MPLWPGTAGAAVGTPARAPGSVRRTSTVDALRPHGIGGPLVLAGRARDLRTGLDGHGEVVAEASTRVTVEYTGARLITELVCDPPVPALATLVGTRAGSGFRAGLDRVAGHLAAEGHLLGLLFDEVPVVLLISGVAVARLSIARGVPPSIAAEPVGGAAGPGAGPGPGAAVPAAGALSRGRAAHAQRGAPPLDICAGWKTGGTMDTWRIEGQLGSVGREPPAPPLEDPADPLGWHDAPTPLTGSVRRRRRLDVAAGPRAGEASVEGIFRDTYVSEDGEVVVHEYGLRATVDRGTSVVTAVEAFPHVLPGPDCPAAAASAGRLAGRPLVGLRDLLRTELVGPSTCTHLTDQLRALADGHALIALLPED